MNDLNEIAETFVRENPAASWEDARQFALERFTDRQQVITFLRVWGLLTAQRDQFAKDVNRIWPEEKGY